MTNNLIADIEYILRFKGKAFIEELWVHMLLYRVYYCRYAYVLAKIPSYPQMKVYKEHEEIGDHGYSLLLLYFLESGTFEIQPTLENITRLQ